MPQGALRREASDFVLFQEISVSTLYGYLPPRLVGGFRAAGPEYHMAWHSRRRYAERALGAFLRLVSLQV